MIRSKDLKVWESIRTKVEGVEKYLFNGLQPTQSKPMKRPIVEEYQIVRTDLHDYTRLVKEVQ